MIRFFSTGSRTSSPQSNDTKTKISPRSFGTSKYAFVNHTQRRNRRSGERRAGVGSPPLSSSLRHSHSSGKIKTSPVMRVAVAKLSPKTSKATASSSPVSACDGSGTKSANEAAAAAALASRISSRIRGTSSATSGASLHTATRSTTTSSSVAHAVQVRQEIEKRQLHERQRLRVAELHVRVDCSFFVLWGETVA